MSGPLDGLPCWSVEMLGRLQVTRAREWSGPPGEPIRFRSRQTACLLAYLAYHAPRGGLHSRELLLEQFWPEADLDAARLSLRVALSSLRGQLEPPGTPPGSILISTRREVGLAPDRFTTDAAQFEEALQKARGAEKPDETAVLLGKAVGLYLGPLLPGYYEEWVETERDRLAGLCGAAALSLVQFRLEAGELTGAVAAAHAVTAADPWNTESLVPLMQMFLQRGAPSEAQRICRQLQKRLTADLGLPIPPELRRLEAEIQQQLADPGAAERFLPARGTDRRMANLPHPPDRFFGRSEELRRLADLLQPGSGRLVTLTGAGGSGKTRLALEAARRAAPSFGNRVWFVPFAALEEPAGLVEHLCRICFPGMAGGGSLPALCSRLAEQPSLLVLDNLEHLVEIAAPVLSELLQAVPTASLLVTSRRLLSLRGERELRVNPLPVPNGLDTLERLRTCASVQLFLDRARAAAPDLDLTEENAEAICAICDTLEGLPLALELASARAAIQSPESLQLSIQGRLDLLESRHRDVEARHRTLRAAIQWSYLLLPARLQRSLEALTVFRAAWTLEAAAVVLSLPLTAAGNQITELVQSSLIQTETHPSGRRFRMLDMIATFAREQVGGEQHEHTEQRRQEWAASRVAGLAPRIRDAEPAAFQILEEERPDLLAALDRLRDRDPVRGLEMAVHLGQFWLNRGYWEEGYRIPCELLAQAVQAPVSLRVRAWIHAAYSVLHREDPGTARAFWQRARQELQDGSETFPGEPGAGDPRTRLEAILLQLEALITWKEGSETEAARLFQRSEVEWRRLDVPRNVTFCLLMQGRILMAGEPEQAEEKLEAAIQIGGKLDHPGVLIAPLTEAGHLAARAGRWEAARRRYQEALALTGETGDAGDRLRLQAALAYVAEQEGQPEELRGYLRDCLQGMALLRDTRMLPACLLLLAAHRLYQGDRVSAPRWLAAAERLQVRTGEALPIWAHRLPACLRETLGPGGGSLPRLNLASQGRLISAMLRDLETG